MSESKSLDSFSFEGAKTMNVAEAFSLFEKSVKVFEEKISEMRLKELFELTDNLRFVTNRLVFNTAYKVLRKRFVELYEYMKSSEKKRKHIDKLFFSERMTAYDITGFEMFHYKSREFDDRPPSEILKEFVDQISGWEK
jgi:hypothetical protein